MKRRFKIAVGVTWIVMTAFPVCADFQTGMGAYRLRHYKWAMKEFKDDQTSASQYNLGVMYFNGEGVKVDHLEGIAWFQKSADQGYALAQYVLGIIYYTGKDVPQDHAAAAKWYRKAAEQGHLQAQFYLGLLYINGEGVENNRNKALLWLKKAALNGHKDAVTLLNAMGEEVPVRSQAIGGRTTKMPLTPGAPSVLPPN